MWVDANFSSVRIRRKPTMARSRLRNGWCEFSARLFAQRYKIVSDPSPVPARDRAVSEFFSGISMQPSCRASSPRSFPAPRLHGRQTAKDSAVPFGSAPRDAGIGNQAEVFAAAIVVDRQNTEFPARPEGVQEEVQRPSPVRLHRHRCAAANGPFAATTATNRQAPFPANSVELLFVDLQALALQHDANAPPNGRWIAEPASLLRDLVHSQTYLRVIGRMFPPHGLRINIDQDTGLAL